MDFKTFREWLLVNGFSQGSTQTFIAKVELFIKTYTELNQENLNSFFASKIEIWNGSTFNLFINSLKNYAKFLKVELEFPKYHRVDKKVKPYLTEEEVNDIIFKIPLIFENPDKVKAIFLFMLSTGLRPKEVISVKRTDFNFETKTFVIKNTKTHKDKTIVLSNELVTMLPAIFAGEQEKINAFNITKEGLGYIFSRIKEMMGISIQFSPYSSRHYFAHLMLKKGLKINELQVAMNHKNVLTTLGYLNVCEDESNEAVRKILNRRKK
jgi:integrase